MAEEDIQSVCGSKVGGRGQLSIIARSGANRVRGS